MFTSSRHYSTKHATLFFSLPFFLILMISTYAQNSKIKIDDLSLIDSYIQAKGYENAIVFSSSNIKQFWIDNSVSAQDDLIQIQLAEKLNVPLKIQLANVNEAQDCRIDIISKSEDFSFTVLNKQLKTIAKSEREDAFLNYAVSSASFHLEDTLNFTFYLSFSSNTLSILEIQKIVLSFSNNEKSAYLVSPGEVNVSDDSVTIRNAQIKEDKSNSFFVTGKKSAVFLNKKILVSNNTLSTSVTIKNTGNQATIIYIGYAPYTSDGRLIDSRNAPYKQNKVFNVVSSGDNSNKIIVDYYPEWKTGCVLALNAKKDLSDYPNFTYLKIDKINRIDDTHSEIILNSSLKTGLKTGLSLRIQSPAGATYLYSIIKKIQPGEEYTYTGRIRKNDDAYSGTSESFCKATYYVIPIILSYSVDSNVDNTVLIQDFTISY